VASEGRVRCCWVHRMRNLLDKVPEQVQAEPKPYPEAVRDAPDHEQGKQRAQDVLGRLERDYPSAARCSQGDLDASLAHLKLPAAHRQSVRTTNLVERSFEEERRRSKAILRFRSERACLKLVFGVLWRASEGWRAVRFSEHERKPLARCVEARQKATQTRRHQAEATVA